MNRSNRRFDPPDEFAGEESDAPSREAIERAHKVRRAIEAGLRFHRHGDLRQAADIYYHVLEMHADQADALHLLGLISYQSDEADAALRLVGRAITSDPNNSVFHISRGNILQALGRLPGAVEAYRQGLALDPELPEGDNNCGNALHAQFKFQEAAGYYQHAIAIRPDYSAAHNNLGNVLRDQGRIEDSIASFEMALCYTPDYATVHNNLGNALRDAGRVEEAISSHRRALSLEPEFAEAHFNLGNALSEAAILDEAVTSYRQAVAISPDFADAYYNLGNALRDDGLNDQAIEAYRGADLGCGTGLAGAAIVDLVESWYGVDLSSAMITEAAAKGFYEGLYVDDIVDYLTTGAGGVSRFELIVAADVFIYVGNLAPTFAAVRDRIAADGLFAFSVELTNDADYVLCPTGRYAHGESHIRALAAKHGFHVEACDAVTLRCEQGQSVAGLVFVLRPER